MRTKKNLLTVAGISVACAIVIWLTASIEGNEKTYDVRPEITIPEYKTDTARLVEAYEHLLDRMMDLTEKNLAHNNSDNQSVTQRLDSIDAKLAEISVRLTRIENKLGIEGPKPTAENLKKESSLPKPD